MRWPVLVALGALGCNSMLGIREVEPEADAAPPSPSPSPSDAAPPRCDPRDPFDDLQLVPGLTTDANERNAWLSPDERTVYFNRDVALPASRLGDIFVAHRDKPDGPFGDATALEWLTTTDDEYRPSVSRDGTTLYFDRQETTGFVTLSSTWSAETQRFETAAPLTDIRQQYDAFEPAVTDREIYFSSQRGGAADLFVARRRDGGFDEPEALRFVNSIEPDEMAVPSADGLTLYFGTTRAGRQFDIWVAHRRDTDAAFTDPEPVGELSTGMKEWPSWLSDDGCRLYFSSDWNGNHDIWVATRTPRP